MTRLYIVEGLPCSGKSTTAKHIADLLEKFWEKVCYYSSDGGRREREAVCRRDSLQGRRRGDRPLP
jgi:tRNA uridine 5-carbamoylmethylation protein Kti12